MISCKFFKIFLKKIKKFCYTYYISMLKFLYILLEISIARMKNLPLFSTNCKISPCVFWILLKFLLFHWNFLKIFPQFIQNPSSFPEYFLKIFTLKICLNIAWKCYECTKNVVRISYKFFRNFWTVHKISSKRLEYLIKFFVQIFLKFSELFNLFRLVSLEIYVLSSYSTSLFAETYWT